MAKRYYLSDVIGTGEPFIDPIRPALLDATQPNGDPLPMSTTIEFDSQTGADGRPVKQWCLVIVDAHDHRRIINDVRNKDLPEFPLDGKMNAMSSEGKGKISAALARHSIVVQTEGVDRSYRNVIRDLGQQLRTSFSEDTFDCPPLI